MYTLHHTASSLWYSHHAQIRTHGDLADSSRRRNWYHNHWNYQWSPQRLFLIIYLRESVCDSVSICTDTLFMAGVVNLSCSRNMLSTRIGKKSQENEPFTVSYIMTNGTCDSYYHMVSSLSLFSVVTIHYSFHRTPVTKTLATWRNGIDQSNHSLPPSPPLLSLSPISLSHAHSLTL